MNWYYTYEGSQIGPVSEEEFNELVAQGRIGPGTLVWRDGMPSWLEYTQLQSGAVSTPDAGTTAVCAECGRVFPQDALIHYGDAWICGNCKPIFVQKLKQGVQLPGHSMYGGFWIRFGAKWIDWMLLYSVMYGFMFLGTSLTGFRNNEETAMIYIVITMVFSIALPAAYNTYLIGRFGATIGKMATSLKVVTSEGEPVSYLRALGRHFAEILSAMILYIGYIMAATDDEKRTLHDRICDTRVVRK